LTLKDFVELSGCNILGAATADSRRSSYCGVS
jgi:hypothetical protein